MKTSDLALLASPQGLLEFGVGAGPRRRLRNLLVRLQERFRERRERDFRPEIDFAGAPPAHGTSISQPDPLISGKTAWLSGMCPQLPAESDKPERRRGVKDGAATSVPAVSARTAAQARKERRWTSA